MKRWMPEKEAIAFMVRTTASWSIESKTIDGKIFRLVHW